MNLFLFDEINFELDIEKLFEKMHIKGKSEYEERFRELVEEARQIARPKGMYKEVYINEKKEDTVTIEGIEFKSKILRINLEEVVRVFPFVATCGYELEEWGHSIKDMLENYWADVIQEEILDNITSVILNHLEHNYQPGATAIMNPGSLEDWPIQEQGKLFQLLENPTEKIGIELTESFLMIPRKSISGIVFPTDVSYENCQLCPRENCPNRRAPYDQELYRKKYSTK